MPYPETDTTLESRLRQVETAKTGHYEKRTEHIDAAGKTRFINRLILEDSPYLLQHAHNPVNWYAWGNEAFESAQQEHKPIFLSIGYSTCHWCHVMEVESFDNVEVAKLLNEHFISIKLDREQFPDIDEVYMTGVQIMSGHGGWPMSNFLLPDGKPFFGATYFPAAGFLHILQQVVDAWNNKYEELSSSARQISATIDRILAERKPQSALDPALAETMLQALLQREDRSFGGLAGAPKFPQEPLLLLMLDRVRRNREAQTLAFVERALEGMGRGGIYDQVAGGFHRYSVDAQWLVPHFEKMLYNQSQLGLVYLHAWQLTRNPFFQRVCTQTLDYVLRDMQLPEGGFYSATDADSEGEEGLFFTWKLQELTALLQPDEVDLARHVFDISESGNFEGSNILELRKSLVELAQESGRAAFYEELDRVLHKLYVAREQRVHPLRDDKLIVAWTSAMTTTLARAAYAMDRSDWLAAAEKAVTLIWSHNVEKQQLRLSRIYLNGTVSIQGQLEDYVNLAEALLVLFDITTNRTYLQQASRVFAAALGEFWDEEAGGFFLSPQQQAGPGITRSRSATDGATLSAVATALHCMVILLQRRALLEVDTAPFLDELEQRIGACTAALSGAVNDNPMSHPSVLRVLAMQQRGSVEPIQFAGQGLARIALKLHSQDEEQAVFAITIQIQSGWHLTAPQARAGSFVPIDLAIADDEASWQLESCDYPPATATLHNPDDDEIPVYTNDIVVRVRVRRKSGSTGSLAGAVGLTLRVQLCNDRNCLLPEVIEFR